MPLLRPGTEPFIRHLREWSVRALLVVLAPALAALLLELLLFVSGRGYDARFWIPLDGGNAAVTNDRFGWRFFPRPLARTPVPVRAAVPKPPGMYRIVLLGESAAMGFPDPGFSVGRVLELLLQDQYPGVRVEVLNAAMTAINSHAILPIAKESLTLSPDLFVVYMGNNEVVGPFGAGTAFGARAIPLRFIRSAIWLQSTRTGQAAQELLRKGRREPTQWRGMEMFLQQQLAADDARLAPVYDNFNHNLNSLIRLAKRNGAGMVLSTVAVNLRDQPPFASVHRDGLASDALARFRQAFDAGVAAAQSGDAQAALGHFTEAIQIDPGYADAHFRSAQLLARAGNTEKAAAHFVAARDLDALRFRADTRINQIIRDAARARSVPLVDAERKLREQSGPAAQVPGSESFYEHVHFTFHGNYLLARALFQSVQSQLPDWMRAKETGRPLTDEAECARRLAMTEWDQERLAFQMADLMRHPPFPAGNAAPVNPPRAESRRNALAAYAGAMQARPEDPLLRARLAQLFRDEGDWATAAQLWRESLKLVPGRKAWISELGFALANGNQLEDAARQYETALALDPDYVPALLGIGAVRERQRDWAKAEAAYHSVLAREPDSPEAHTGLGRILAAQGRRAQARTEFEKAIESRPGWAEPLYLSGLALLEDGDATHALSVLDRARAADPAFAAAHAAAGNALLKLGRTAEAITAYETAVRLRPDLARVHYDLGVLLARQGDLPRAEAHYRETLRVLPQDPDAHNNLGICLAREGKTTEARQHFEAALQSRPGFAQARQNLALLGSAVR